MSGLTLHLDVDRWRRHLRAVAADTPGLVPVVKGNGYGFGLARLAAESAALGVDAIAVGLPAEVEEVRSAGKSVVILNPWEAHDPRAVELAEDPQVLTTVSRLEDLAALADLQTRPRVLVEVLTSMRRHGIEVSALDRVALLLDRVRFEGWSLHLPLRGDGLVEEAERLSRAALAVAPGPLWISHLSVGDATAMARRLAAPGGDPVPLRLRSGTRLWLGAPESRRATATVLDVHKVARGDRAGYRQRACGSSGWVVVVAGGTSHGVGMEAPTSASSSRQRAVALVTGGLEASGRALSPYTVAGRKRWFLEPPHMQSSQLFLPESVTPPARGTEIPVELRLTTVTVDRIVED